MERLLENARLLTLTGPGGCGKTRLAVAALEVRGGKIVRQVDVVARDPPADREEDIGPGVAKGEGK